MKKRRHKSCMDYRLQRNRWICFSSKFYQFRCYQRYRRHSNARYPQGIYTVFTPPFHKFKVLKIQRKRYSLTHSNQRSIACFESIKKLKQSICCCKCTYSSLRSGLVRTRVIAHRDSWCCMLSYNMLYELGSLLRPLARNNLNWNWRAQLIKQCQQIAVPFLICAKHLPSQRSASMRRRLALYSYAYVSTLEKYVQNVIGGI